MFLKSLTKLGTYDNLDITICKKPITRELLCEFINKDDNNILLLNDDSQILEMLNNVDSNDFSKLSEFMTLKENIRAVIYDYMKK